METPVRLHVYDISRGLAARLSPVFLGRQINGLYHTNVVVGDTEYSYGPPLRKYPVGESLLGQPDRVLDLGVTRLPTDMLDDLLRSLGRERFAADKYDILYNNCNHFANEFALMLTGDPIPPEFLSQTETLLDSPMGEYLMRCWGGRSPAAGAPGPTPQHTGASDEQQSKGAAAAADAEADPGPSTSTAKPRQPPPAAAPGATSGAADPGAAFEGLLRDVMRSVAGDCGGRQGFGAMGNIMSLLGEAAGCFAGPAAAAAATASAAPGAAAASFRSAAAPAAASASTTPPPATTTQPKECPADAAPAAAAAAEEFAPGAPDGSGCHGFGGFGNFGCGRGWGRGRRGWGCHPAGMGVGMGSGPAGCPFGGFGRWHGQAHPACGPTPCAFGPGGFGGAPQQPAAANGPCSGFFPSYAPPYPHWYASHGNPFAAFAPPPPPPFAQPSFGGPFSGPAGLEQLIGLGLGAFQLGMGVGALGGELLGAHGGSTAVPAAAGGVNGGTPLVVVLPPVPAGSGGWTLTLTPVTAQPSGQQEQQQAQHPRGCCRRAGGCRRRGAPADGPIAEAATPAAAAPAAAPASANGAGVVEDSAQAGEPTEVAGPSVQPTVGLAPSPEAVGVESRQPGSHSGSVAGWVAVSAGGKREGAGEEGEEEEGDLEDGTVTAA